MKYDIRTKHRDLSWLSFNHRVLQEAKDPSVPLYERVKFLAIYSSNADEFFRIRVASLRAMMNLKKKTAKKLGFDPEKLLLRIRKVVESQQEEFGDTFRASIKKELKKNKIVIVRDDELNRNQRRWVLDYFTKNVGPLINPIFLHAEKQPPFLRNRALYLAIHLARKAGIVTDPSDVDQHAIIEIPTGTVDRFVQLPSSASHHYIMFLDDVIRVGLPQVFPNHTIVGVYAIKLTRDAELYIEDEFSGNLVEKIKKALSKRDTGPPSRFLFDLEMPQKFQKLMKEVFSLSDDDYVIGGRYHNFSDLFSLPNPVAPQHLYEPMKQLSRKGLGPKASMMNEMSKRDIILHYPYHAYDPVIRFLQEAADDQKVLSIQITLYRVARTSGVLEALLRAVHNGKAVTVFLEVKARFDEEANIKWAEELEKVGARVLYSFPGWKVHAKLCLVTMKGRSSTPKRYAYLSTGNFNEKTASFYADEGFFTSDLRLTAEVDRVFSILSRVKTKPKFKHLLVAPFTMRRKFNKLIEREIKAARNGKKAFLIVKMNSLEDPEMIAQLYNASEAGVKITLLVRGICCLLPGVKGLSSNITVLSIVDRFLEHSRIFLFHNGGKELIYLSSGDWMTRNLSRRIEVAFPIFDKEIRTEIKHILDFQIRDNTKARIVNKRQDNQYQQSTGEKIRAQEAIYEHLKSK